MWTIIGLAVAALIIGFSILHVGKRAERFAAPERRHMHGCCIACGHGCTADEMDRCYAVECERQEQLMDAERWDGLS